MSELYAIQCGEYAYGPFAPMDDPLEQAIRDALVRWWHADETTPEERGEPPFAVPSLIRAVAEAAQSRPSAAGAEQTNPAAGGGK